MVVIRLLIVALTAALPLASLAQDGETPAAPQIETPAEAPALVAAGQSIFGRLVAVVPAPPAEEADDPCPLENEVPVCFDLDSVRRGALQPVATEAARDARVLTLQAIESYTGLVAAVAEGKTPLTEEQAEALRDAVEELGAFGDVLKIAKGVVQVVVPVPQALSEAGFAIIGELVTRIRDNRTAEAQSEALLAGAAAVDGMIAGLIDETPNVYEIYRLARNDELITLEEELALAGLTETPPEAAATTETAADGLPPTGDDEATPPRATDAIEADIAAIRADIRTFHGDLATYVVLLDQRRAATKILVEAAAQAVASEPGETAASLGKVALERVSRSNDLLKILGTFVKKRFN